MPKKILLADDSITIQKVVELTFSDGDYEVTATSNGTRAIEQIPQIRPDIILSDIIMPEKNGYELCEWVKSHPEYRRIPVILLTGTFEPFDPDRAEKAGCDAVVTKPFESQSLIQKVEELIQASATADPGQEEAAAEPEDDGSSFSPGFPEETDQEETPQTPAFELDESPMSSFTDSGSDEPAAPPFPDLEEEPRAHGDVFEAETPGDGGTDFDDTATRMIPKMSFDEIQRLQQQETAAQPTGEGTMDSSIEGDAFEPASESQPEPASEDTAVPSSISASFEEEAEPDRWEDDATRMMPKMSFEEIQRLQQQGEQPPVSESEAEPSYEAAESSSPEPEGYEPEAPQAESVWGSPAEEEAAPFEEAPQTEEPASTSEAQEEPQPSAFDQEPEDDGATRMIPKMSFEEMQRLQQEGSEAEPPSESSSPLAGAVPSPAAEEAPVNPFAVPGEEAQPETEPVSPFGDDLPAEPGAPREEVSSLVSDEEPDEWAPASPAAEPAPTSEPSEPEPAVPAEARSDLDDEQVERIARRVVEMLSDRAIRDIAWEVIPETAEMIVRERIRELESEEG
jgi:CheY-like chemotaxis protein